MRVLILSYTSFSILILVLYFIKAKYFYIPAVVMTAVVFSCQKISGLSLHEGICIAGIIWCGTISIRLGKEVFKHYKHAAEHVLDSRKKRYEKLSVENQQLISRKDELDEKAFSIGKIYETMKAMSGILKTGEIVSIFSAFLNENFSFSRCHLVIFDQELQYKEARKNYIIEKDIPDIKELHPNKMEEWKRLCLLFVDENRRRQIIKAKDPLRKKLNIDTTLRRMDIIPLTVENAMIATVFIENLDDSAAEIFLVLVSQLTMELKKASLYEGVEKLSFTDGLTGISLRRYFVARLEEEIKRTERLKLQFAVLLIDIDNFKRCNDTYGHMVGDVVLREVAALIKVSIREIDLVARYGGEEFTVLLPDTAREAAYNVAERIRTALESKKISAYDETLQVTVSIGISRYPQDSIELDGLIHKADSAMYSSKQNGRNLVTIYGESSSGK